MKPPALHRPTGQPEPKVAAPGVVVEDRMQRIRGLRPKAPTDGRTTAGPEVGPRPESARAKAAESARKKVKARKQLETWHHDDNEAKVALSETANMKVETDMQLRQEVRTFTEVSSTKYEEFLLTSMTRMQEQMDTLLQKMMGDQVAAMQRIRTQEVKARELEMATTV